MRGLDFDDPLWDDLLDELTADEIYNTIGVSGYGIEYIDSVEKPFNIDADTAAGLLYGGTGAMFPNAMTLAQTWNLDLASEYGTMIGNEGLLGGADGWYAPSMNIHRTPYSGRNGEYYSEDAFLSGAVAPEKFTELLPKVCILTSSILHSTIRKTIVVTVTDNSVLPPGLMSSLQERFILYHLRCA